MKKKSLMKNSFYYIMYRLINVLYPLITATYVSRVLEPDGIGDVSLAQTIVTFLVACALLGIPNYGVREISKIENEKEKSTVFFELFIINAISTLIVSVLYYCIINFMTLNINKTLFNIEGIILLLNFINVDWFYQGIEEFKYITIRSCIVKLLSMIAIFSFIKEKNDICIYALIFSMAYAGNYIFNVINLNKHLKFKYISKINPKKHLKNIMILAVTYISNEVYVTVDCLMLGIMTVNIQVGYYSNAMKLIKILINVFTAIGVALLPRISSLRSLRKNDEVNKLIEKVIKLLLFITIPSMLGIIFISKNLIILLFGDEFIPSYTILIILSFLIVFRTFSNLFLQILISDNKDNNVSKTYFIAMILNIMLNLLLIPMLKANGAALASIISEFYIMIVLFVNSKKYNIISIDEKSIVNLIISNIFIIIELLLISKLSIKIIIKVPIQIISSIIIYIIINYLLKNEVIIDFINILKEKRRKNVNKCKE